MAVIALLRYDRERRAVIALRSRGKRFHHDDQQEIDVERPEQSSALPNARQRTSPSPVLSEKRPLGDGSRRSAVRRPKSAHASRFRTLRTLLTSDRRILSSSMASRGRLACILACFCFSLWTFAKVMALSSPQKSPARSCRTCRQPIHSRDVYYNLARKGNRDLANSLRRLCPSLPPGFPDLICYGCNKVVGKVQTGYRKIESLRAKYEMQNSELCICRKTSLAAYAALLQSRNIVCAEICRCVEACRKYFQEPYF